MQHTAEIYWFCCFKVSEALAIIKLHPQAIKFNAVMNTCDYFYSEHRLCGGTLRVEQTVKSACCEPARCIVDFRTTDSDQPHSRADVSTTEDETRLS